MQRQIEARFIRGLASIRLSPAFHFENGWKHWSAQRENLLLLDDYCNELDAVGFCEQLRLTSV